MPSDIMKAPARERRRSSSIFTDERIRSLLIQVGLVVALVLFGIWLVANTTRNLQQANIATGFGFLSTRSGFDIALHAIDYSSDATYGRALFVGFINTLIIASTGCVMATILGFLVGVGRLSTNFLVRGLSTLYVETFRNIPPLLVILFWYFGVLAVLPRPNQAVVFPFGAFLSNRGLQTPKAIFEATALISLGAFAVGVLATLFLARYYKAKRLATGERHSLFLPAVGLVIVMPLVVFLASGIPVSFEVPVETRFNLSGGFQIKPEFLAIFLALSVYTGAFIAEIVRAGIMAVSHGQTEAASALGLRRGATLRLVVVPQAFRVIIPPLTSQYLNLTKNSSLGLAIGYPELVAVGSTVLNQTGQSVEVVAIWMVVYLTISLAVSLLMNWFNAKMALVER